MVFQFKDELCDIKVPRKVFAGTLELVGFGVGHIVVHHSRPLIILEKIFFQCHLTINRRLSDGDIDHSKNLLFREDADCNLHRMREED